MTISDSAFTSSQWISGLYWKTIGRRSRRRTGPRDVRSARARRRTATLTGVGRHADLQVGGTEARVHRPEADEEIVTQLLGHALAAHEAVQLIVLPLEPVAVAHVEHALQERGVAADGVPIARAKGAQRGEDLVQVRAGRLDQAVSVHARGGVDPCRPRTHRERVDGDERRGAEDVASENAMLRCATVRSRSERIQS